MKVTFNEIMNDITELYKLRPQDEDDSGDAYEAVREATETKLVSKGYDEESAADLIEDLLLLMDSLQD